MSATISRPMSQTAPVGRLLAVILAAGIAIAGIGIVANRIATTNAAPQAAPAAPFNDSLEEYQKFAVPAVPFVDRDKGSTFGTGLVPDRTSGGWGGAYQGEMKVDVSHGGANRQGFIAN